MIVASSYAAIGSEMDALQYTSWVATAYMLSTTSFQYVAHNGYRFIEHQIIDHQLLDHSMERFVRTPWSLSLITNVIYVFSASLAERYLWPQDLSALCVYSLRDWLFIVRNGPKYH